jgi:hypothetical protein
MDLIFLIKPIKSNIISNILSNNQSHIKLTTPFINKQITNNILFQNAIYFLMAVLLHLININ